jgi:lysosomal alpha-mannosidase
MNVDEQAESFALDMRTRAKIYNTNNILVTFGCDFAYSNADINFKNMEKLMNFINNNASFGVYQS